ncbi:hypothetical protein NIES2104_22640 [Leptolyngbya sp. NIES-2104]|nr:hypothetical protein NIES2104_22640 [Leptolyngbya sp. NIES-2104]
MFNDFAELAIAQILKLACVDRLEVVQRSQRLNQTPEANVTSTSLKSVILEVNAM